MGYLEALEDTQEDDAEMDIVSQAQLPELEGPQAFEAVAVNNMVLFDHRSKVGDEFPASQDSTSNVSSRPLSGPDEVCNTTPAMKRKHVETETHFAFDDDPFADDRQGYTEVQQDHAFTSNNEPTDDIPKPFITPNLALARSIDHSKTNPSNAVRLKTPYPAPADIFAASHQKYLSNIAVANAKAAAGASDSSNRIPFTVYEDDRIIQHMLAVSKDPSVPQTEERFAEVSRRLCGDGSGVYRSGTAIKNMWCRVGRGRSGYDERKGVRRNGMHVVNGWRAKPGNQKKGTPTKKRKLVEEMSEDEWFEL